MTSIDINIPYGYIAAEERTHKPETSRAYFERQAQFGQKLILQYQHPRQGERIEGFRFTSEDAALKFDIDRVDWAASDMWRKYNTWEEAQEWLRS